MPKAAQPSPRLNLVWPSGLPIQRLGTSIVPRERSFLAVVFEKMLQFLKALSLSQALLSIGASCSMLQYFSHTSRMLIWALVFKNMPKSFDDLSSIQCLLSSKTS